MNYTYKATVSRVIDGDTIHLKVDLGFRIHAEIECRLYGINTPEIVGTEKTAGLAAKAGLEQLLKLGEMRIETTKSDKYGRWLAKIYVMDGKEEVYVNQRMLDEGFALAYFGEGPKPKF
jgi:micrococcal nuclease